MRKSISILITFFFVANVSAQIKVNSSGSMGIGTTNPQYKLHVVGNAYLSGTVLFGGNITAQNIYAARISSTGQSSLIFMVNGVMAGSTGNSSYTNVSFGYGALPNNVASYSGSVAVGTRALSNNKGSWNVGTGYQALYSNTTGNYNIASGSNTLYKNTTGSYNIASGNQALYNNTTGGYNIASGSQALYNNTTGHDNVAIGNSSLLYSQTGSYNIAIGTSALCYHTSGNNNTVIGYSAGGMGDYSNSTAIGYGAAASASNQVRIGNSSVTSIGGYAPWSNISDGRAKKNIRADVPGLAFINLLQPVTYNLNLDALDGLMKKDKMEKNDLPQELAAVNKKVREARQKQVQTGFVAQDVEETAKSIGYDFSGVDRDELGIYALRYSEFVVPLVKAVQELSAQNDRLSESLKEQQGIIEELIQKMENLGEGASVSKLRSYAGESTLTDLSNAIIEQCKLHQNVPNPFNQDTQIRFYIPENVAVAQLCIYNLQGAQIKQIRITQRGEGSQWISGSELTAGMYLYALIVDGQEVDTKRMILTK